MARKIEKMTRSQWEKYQRETYDLYRRLGVEGEDIDITPEKYGVKIVEDNE